MHDNDTLTDKGANNAADFDCCSTVPTKDKKNVTIKLNYYSSGLHKKFSWLTGSGVNALAFHQWDSSSIHGVGLWG